jgi:hypothetical protein
MAGSGGIATGTGKDRLKSCCYLLRSYPNTPLETMHMRGNRAFCGESLLGVLPLRPLICRNEPHIHGTNTAGVRSMTGMDQRKDAAEKKYAHDEELAFKANARRAKLIGLWVAGQIGKTGADADAYAKSVVMADFEEAGDEDVFRKVRADLNAGGKTDVSDHVIRRTMDELMATAVEQIKAGS